MRGSLAGSSPATSPAKVGDNAAGPRTPEPTEEHPFPLFHHREKSRPAAGRWQSEPASAQGDSEAAAEHGHVAVELDQAEAGAPPVSSPPPSPRKLEEEEKEQEEEEEARLAAARLQDQHQAVAEAEAAAATAAAAAAAQQRDQEEKEAARRQAEERQEAAAIASAAASAGRAADVVSVSDALFASVLQEILDEDKGRQAPQSQQALAQAPAPASDLSVASSPDPAAAAQLTRTPSPGRRPPAPEHADSPSPGAQALLASIDSPRPVAAAGAPAADDVLAAAARIAAGGAKSAGSAVAYARLVLAAVDDAALAKGLHDDTFLQLARDEFRHLPEDAQVFHKLVFDVIKCELEALTDAGARSGAQVQSRYQGSRSAYGVPLPRQLSPAQAAQVRSELLDRVARLAKSGDWLPAGGEGEAQGGQRQVPSSESDLTALQALVDHDLVAMERQWLCYDAEEDVISLAVADALFEDLLYEVTADLVD